MELPSKLTDNLVYSSEAQFVVRTPCTRCLGTGVTTEQNKRYNTATTLDGLICEYCKGKGYLEQYLTLYQLFGALKNDMFEQFMKELPEIIERSKLAIVQSIMES